MQASRYADPDDSQPEPSPISPHESKPLPLLPSVGGLDASRFAAGSPGPELSPPHTPADETTHAQNFDAKVASPRVQKPLSTAPASVAGEENNSSAGPDPLDGSTTASLTVAIPDNAQRILSPSPSAKTFKKIQSKKGKPCIIRVPIGDAYRRPGWMPLSQSEVRARLEAFKQQGYATAGWDVDRQVHSDASQHAQNRAEFPGPQDVESDMKDAKTVSSNSSTCVVCIPDRRKWEAYVNELTEAKLRALGVFTAEEEPAPPPSQAPPPPRSVASPFGALAKSPPVPSSSAASQNPWANSVPFSSPFSPASATNNTSMSGFASPVPSVRQGQLSRQSTFNFQFPMAQSASGMLPGFVPQQPFQSPPPQSQSDSPGPSAAFARLPSFSWASDVGDRLSDKQPTPKPVTSNPSRAESVQQSPKPTAVDSHVKENRPSTPEWRRKPQDGQETARHNEDDYGELAYPTPRGHRHNISESLEREVENAEYYPGEFVNNQANGIKSSGWGNIQGNMKQDSVPFQMRFGHQPSASVASNASSTTKLNVAAKEFKFDPKAAHGRDYSMSKSALLPSNSAQPEVSFVTAHSDGTSTGGSNFDARAPAFKPPTALASFPFSSGFSFSAKHEPSHKSAEAVEAPKDLDAVSSTQPAPSMDDEKQSKGGIFGSLSFKDFIKPAKISKAIPIVNPNAQSQSKAIPIVKPDDYISDQDPEEDEQGRIAQSKARFKRGRLATTDGDDVPQFASPTPEPQASEIAHVAPNKEDDELAQNDAIAKEDDQLIDMSDDPWHELDDSPRQLDQRTAASEDSEPDLKQQSDQDAPEVPLHVTQATEKPISTAEASSPGADLISVDERTPAIKESSPKSSSNQNIKREPSESGEISESHTSHSSRAEQPAKLSEVLHPTIELQRSGSVPSQERVPLQQGTGMAAEWLRDQRHMRASQSPVRKLNVVENPEVSDWDDMLASGDEAKFFQQTSLLDSRAKPSIDLILRDQLGSLQRSIRDVEAAVTKAASRNEAESRLNSVREKSSSDADDEDDDHPDPQRLQHPKANKKRMELKTIVGEAIAALEMRSSERFDELQRALADSAHSSSIAALEVKSLERFDELQRAVTDSANSSSITALETKSLERFDELQRAVANSANLSSTNIDKRNEELKTVLSEAIHSSETNRNGSQNDLKNSVLEAIHLSESTRAQHHADLKDALTEALRTADATRQAQQEENKLAVAEAKKLSEDDREANLSAIRSAVSEEIKVWETKNLSQQLESALQREREINDKSLNLQKRLELSEKEIALYKDSSEDLEAKVQGLEEEKRLKANLMADLSSETDKLRTSLDQARAKLDEYRSASEKWRRDIEQARNAREHLSTSLSAMRKDADENERERDELRKKIEDIQSSLSSTTTTLVSERQSSQKKEEDQAREIMVLGVRLEEELRSRSKLERDIQRLGGHEREAIRATVTLEETQKSNARLSAELEKTRGEARRYQDRAAHFEREFNDAQDHFTAQNKRTETMMSADIAIAKKLAENVRADLETRLQMAQKDHEVTKSSAAQDRDRHQKAIESIHNARREAIREASDTHNARLAEERQRFEKSLNEASAEHERALRLAFDDRKRLESRLDESAALAKEKTDLLQEKILHLQDKVTIAQSAAQAAASAAQQSVKPSPSLTAHSERALRESIVVLQEQLREREGRIESLESQLKSVDKDLPQKLNERETEIGWLRELLTVRVDDISDLVTTLSQDDFDRETTRDAAIRIRANLQMEQQLRERSAARSQSGSSHLSGPQLPSFADIQNFATPRAAQLAAAWGSWRKGGASPMAGLRENVMQRAASAGFSVGSASEATPSKRSNTTASSTSAQAFLSGLMTPPATNVRRTPSSHDSSASHRSAQAGSQENILQKSPSRKQGQDRLRSVTPERRPNGEPRTPPLLRKASYDEDAAAAGAFDDDLSDDEEPDTETVREAGLVPLGDELARAEATSLEAS